jgi:hypothetical protein
VHPALLEGSPIDPLNAQLSPPCLGLWGGLGRKGGASRSEFHAPDLTCDIWSQSASLSAGLQGSGSPPCLRPIQPCGRPQPGPDTVGAFFWDGFSCRWHLISSRLAGRLSRHPAQLTLSHLKRPKNLVLQPCQSPSTVIKLCTSDAVPILEYQILQLLARRCAAPQHLISIIAPLPTSRDGHLIPTPNDTKPGETGTSHGGRPKTVRFPSVTSLATAKGLNAGWLPVVLSRRPRD